MKYIMMKSKKIIIIKKVKILKLTKKINILILIFFIKST